MQIIIDIPEEKYKHIQEEQWMPNRLLIEKAIANGTPLNEVLDKIRVEIGKSKTEHEMQLAERDTKGKLLISDIYCDIVKILNKYKAESEEQQ